MGSPPSENEKRPDFSDLCVIIQFLGNTAQYACGIFRFVGKID